MVSDHHGGRFRPKNRLPTRAKADDLFEETLAAQTIQKAAQPLEATICESHFPWKSPKHCSQKAGSLQRHQAKDCQVFRIRDVRVELCRQVTVDSIIVHTTCQSSVIDSIPPSVRSNGARMPHYSNGGKLTECSRTNRHCASGHALMGKLGKFAQGADVIISTSQRVSHTVQFQHVSRVLEFFRHRRTGLEGRLQHA